MFTEILTKRQTFKCPYLLCCFIYFGLTLRQVIITNAYNVPNWESDCHCIPLKFCHHLNEQIERTRNFSKISYLIKKSLCHFNGLEISVCCHKSEDLYYIGNTFNNNSNESFINEIFESNTLLNCPPAFGKEYHYDEYIRKNQLNHNHYDFENDKQYNDMNKRFPGGTTTFTTIVLDDLNRTEAKSCGIFGNDVITNGILYPWIVRLAYLNNTRMTVNYRCMGSVIHTKYILTAAHCVINLVEDIQLISVRFGPDDNYIDFDIAETIVHPNYNQPLFNNDVALLKLSSSSIANISNDEFVRICLPENNLQRSRRIEEGFVGSWNKAGSSNTNVSTINYINLTIMNNTECAIRYARYSENFERNIIITPTEFCAQAATTITDVCEGDSGGPFMFRNDANRYIIIGIVAFGPNTNCGQSNLPGVYTNVSSHNDWITRVIALN